MLTKRQKEVLNFIEEYHKKHEYAPSLKEIQKKFKLKSVATVHQHIKTLESKGYLEKKKNHPRSIHVNDQESFVYVPKEKDVPKKKRNVVNNFNDLTASEWLPETISVYVQKGLGAGHDDTKIERQHPAPYSYQDVARLINFFTKKGNRVLDPFVGVGSTLKACALNEREGVGVELVKKYYDLTNQRLKKEVYERDKKYPKQKVIRGDALKAVEKFEDDEFDFIVTSPPYWNILSKVDHKAKTERLAEDLDTKYSDLKKDLGNIDNYDVFIETLSGFFNSCSRVLKPKKYMAIVISDFRNKDRYYKFHSDLSQKLEDENFTLKGIKILYQRHKKVFPYGYPYSYVPNIHHQYILILQNNKV